MYRSQNTRLLLPTLLVAMILLLAGPLNGQQNPFEIKNRTSKDTNEGIRKDTVVPDTTLIIDSLVDPVSSSDTGLALDTMHHVQIGQLSEIDSHSAIGSIASPDGNDSVTFEQIATDTSNQDDQIVIGDSSSTSQEGLIDRLENMDIDRTLVVNNRNLLFGISILILLLLASLLAVNRSIIRKSYRAIANDNYLRFLHREYRTMPWLYWLFYLHFFMNGGFFVYLVINHFGWHNEGSLLVLLLCILGVLGAYLVKHLSLSALAKMFPVDKEVQLYGFVTMLINILLGLALLPINLLAAFATLQIVTIAVWVGIVVILVLYFFRQLKGLFISGRLVTSYLFHFFLYLCTAEIAPLLIVGKLALGNFEGH